MHSTRRGDLRVDALGTALKVLRFSEAAAPLLFQFDPMPLRESDFVGLQNGLWLFYFARARAHRAVWLALWPSPKR